MANKLYEENDIRAIANAIREKTGGTETYTVGQMADAIGTISGGGDYNIETTANEDGSQNIIITDAEGGGGGDGNSYILGIGKNPVLLDEFTETWTLADTTFQRGYAYTTATEIMPQVYSTSPDAYVYYLPDPSYYTENSLFAISETKIEYEYDEYTNLDGEAHIMTTVSYGVYYRDLYEAFEGDGPYLATMTGGTYSGGIVYNSSAGILKTYASSSYGIYAYSTPSVSFSSDTVKIGRQALRAYSSAGYMSAGAFAALKDAKFTRTVKLYKLDPNGIAFNLTPIVRERLMEEVWEVTDRFN